MKVVSKEMIKVFEGGKKTKVRTKTKNVDDYLKLFIDAHCLPHNRRCQRVHLNFFFSNHGAYLIQCPSIVCLFFS